MAVRDFTDPAGVAWRVWHTKPIADAPRIPGYERGWLTFESSSGSVRRLTPVPLDWERVSDVQLAMLCRAATDAPQRRAAPYAPAADGPEASHDG